MLFIRISGGNYMKSVLLLLLVLGGVSASAFEVSFKCSPKAYACTPGGACRWTEMYQGIVTTVRLDRDLSDRDVYRARYQSYLDNHQLTLDFRYDEKSTNRPLRVNAYLGATNVMAESSGTNTIDIALRNNVFGRGFNCRQIQVR